MVLANPLTTNMIEAAGNIRQQLVDWQTTDETLAMLHKSFPGFNFEEVLLKATVVNSLYATNVYAIWKAAKHVCQTIGQYNLDSAGAEFVEKIARVPGIKTKSGKDRKFVSFASKFAHFFIDQEHFPIMDSYAVSAIKFHLGRGKWEKCSGDKPYKEFVVNFTKLKKNCGFSGSVRDFDYYLWLAGLFLAWKKNNNAKINKEAKDFFADEANQSIIEKAFAGGL